MKYNLIPLAFSIIIFYLFSLFLVKKRIINPIGHYRFWNILLLVSFLASAILGLLLVARLEFGLHLYRLHLNVLFWHVEAGIALTVISIFHICRHWRYFKDIFKKDRKS